MRGRKADPSISYQTGTVRAHAYIFKRMVKWSKALDAVFHKVVGVAVLGRIPLYSPNGMFFNVVLAQQLCGLRCQKLDKSWMQS